MLGEPRPRSPPAPPLAAFRDSQRGGRRERCKRDWFAMQGAGAVGDNFSFFVDHADQFFVRQIRHRFHFRLEKVELSRSDQPLARFSEATPARVSSGAHFFEMSVQIEREIESIVEESREQAEQPARGAAR